MRWWMILLVVAMVGAAIWMLQSQFGGPTVQVVEAQTGSIREFIEERGKTRLPESHVITVPFAGRVRPVEFEEGQTVRENQVVAQMVPTDLHIELDEATASVDRLSASILETGDTSVEQSGLKQSQQLVTSMEKTVASAVEQVKASQVQLRIAQQRLKRRQKLIESGNIPPEELEQAELDLANAEVEHRQNLLDEASMRAMLVATQLLPTAMQQYIARKGLSADVLRKQKEEAAAKVNQVQLKQARREMKSPVNGVILERAVISEQWLSAGTKLLKIGALEDLEIEADLLTRDAVRLNLTESANPIRVEIYGAVVGDSPLQGTVQQVFPEGFTKVSSLGVEEQRVKVIVSIDKEARETLLKTRSAGVGYRVLVRIITAEKENALVVPRTAVFRSPTGGWQAYVVRNRQATLQAVKIGLMNDDRVEITAGIESGEKVVLAPEASLSDGMIVTADVQPRTWE